MGKDEKSFEAGGKAMLEVLTIDSTWQLRLFTAWMIMVRPKSFHKKMLEMTKEVKDEMGL